jgi:hypothetical protein
MIDEIRSAGQYGKSRERMLYSKLGEENAFTQFVRPR